jgi:putative DNA primase/helicase
MAGVAMGRARRRKVPLTPHGILDAAVDEAAIRRMFGGRRDALVAIATGGRSDIVALDIDIRPAGSGLESLQALGVTYHPSTPTAHTPSGGIHCLFTWPGHEVPCSAGKLGPYLDVRGDGGALILPPGTGRFWDPHLGLDTPVAPMPAWMHIKKPEPVEHKASAPGGKLSQYCETALRNACESIIKAPAGAQETTLNKEAFAIGSLVAGHGMPPGLALDVLMAAANRMPTFDVRRPWRQWELDRKVIDSFAAGLRHPREARRG